MTNLPLRITTRVLPNGEVIVVIEPIIVVTQSLSAADVDRNSVVPAYKSAKAAPLK